ncbi:MAG: DUF3347 domain-containing protein [Saonia sp.]
MKRNEYATLIAITVLTFASCGEEKKKQAAGTDSPTEMEAKKEKIAKASFSDEMTGKVFRNYLQLKIALTNSDVQEAQMAAAHLSEVFAEELDTLKTITGQLAKTDDLERQRELFSDFTAKVEPLFRDNISSGILYKKFCPMAFNGDGGYWFSDDDRIRNPYYGEKMLKCGQVTETIQ